MDGPESAQRLLQVLETEERLYVELRAVLQEERVRMANLDADGLETVVRAKETLAEEARLLEESRIDVAGALARELGLEDAQPTLSRLCERLGGSGEPLAEAHARLVALVGAVRELLDINAAFSRESLAQVQATLQLLGRLIPAEATYQPGGAGEASGPGRLLRQSA